MIRIDDTLLEEIGLIALPKQDRDQLLRQIYETLEMRVGMRLAERMTDQQLDEFERFIDTNDEAGALKWLESNFPDYKQVVADELEKLKGEIKKDSSKIIEAMQAQGAQQPTSLPTAQQPPAFSPSAPQPVQPPQQAQAQPFQPQPSATPQPQPAPSQYTPQPAPSFTPPTPVQPADPTSGFSQSNTVQPQSPSPTQPDPQSDSTVPPPPALG